MPPMLEPLADPPARQWLPVQQAPQSDRGMHTHTLCHQHFKLMTKGHRGCPEELIDNAAFIVSTPSLTPDFLPPSSERISFIRKITVLHKHLTKLAITPLSLTHTHSLSSDPSINVVIL